MPLIAEILIAFFLVVGGVFGLVGSFGMLKLRDTMQRLHAPTKATTLGVGGVLIASMIYFYVDTGKISFHELLITLFLFLTAPITANFIAKTYMQAHIRPEDLPGSERDYGWSLYSDPPGDRDEQDQ
ncbi:Na+/H+ antiporter subunit G [Pseudoruegeria sp. HB172150]|uniref:Na+/H+ antiporter subunit G n=1 Tax=Pseudoruegeria sp. HB172150 TaxID=2721164 RepID=UPI001557F484|nr:Na+/H+ antiporter subunit G [Pseudoruegeria sp. HB172150]